MLDQYMDKLSSVGVDARTHFNLQIQRVVDRLGDISEAIDALDVREERIRIPAQDDADGAGLAVIGFPIQRAGYMYLVEHLSIVVDGGAAAIGAFYTGPVEQWNLAHVVDDADFYTTLAPMNRLVPEGAEECVLRITGAPANAKCHASIQVLRLRRER